MARGKSKYGKKRYNKKRYNKKRDARKGKGKSGIAEYASLSVKRTLNGNGPGGLFNDNVLYSLMNTQLADFPRAVQVAAAYQFFKIKRISVTFKPSYDTYISGPANVTKPRLYWMLDKSGAIPTNIALEGLKAMGARPFEIDEKPRVVSWAPSVLEAAMDVAPATIAARYRISPWLSCNNAPLTPGAFIPSIVDHLGLYWYMDQLNNPQGQLYQVEVEVQFQFKKPLWNATSAVNAHKVTYAVINNSPDGIVGGGDGDLSGNAVVL